MENSIWVFLRFFENSDAFALGEGFLLGKDDDFSRGFLDVVRKAGITHIVAASGANLVFLERMLLPFFNSLAVFYKKSILLLIVMSYFFVVGSSGSLWRATVMWFIRWLAWWWGRRVSLSWLLVLTVIITYVFKRDFLQSASFWLSWLAMLGVWFSHLKIFREKKRAFFSQQQKFIFATREMFFTGWGVLLFVSLWLWPQYKVFQPHGVLVTWGIDPIVLPYMVLAMLKTLLEQIMLQLKANSFVSIFHSFVFFLDTIILCIFYVVKVWIAVWLWILQNRTISFVVSMGIVLGGFFDAWKRSRSNSTPILDFFATEYVYLGSGRFSISKSIFGQKEV